MDIYTEVSKETGYSRERVKSICMYIMYCGSRLKYPLKTKQEVKEYLINYIGGLH